MFALSQPLQQPPVTPNQNSGVGRGRKPVPVFRMLQTKKVMKKLLVLQSDVLDCRIKVFEVRVLHGVLGGDTALRVVDQHALQNSIGQIRRPANRGCCKTTNLTKRGGGRTK